MSQLVVVDFDRTLFNNHEFFTDFSAVLASYYEIDGQQLHDLARKHDVVRSHATGIFSAFDEIRHTHEKVDIDHLKQTVRNELSGRNYLIVDAIPLISKLKQAKTDFLIMTVGTDEYQSFKAEFAPELNVCELIVTQDTKSAEIKKLIKNRQLQPENITLIDDRGDTFDSELKAMDVRGVRLRRVDSQYQNIQSPGWVEEISSLGEFELGQT